MSTEYPGDGTKTSVDQKMLLANIRHFLEGYIEARAEFNSHQSDWLSDVADALWGSHVSEKHSDMDTRFHDRRYLLWVDNYAVCAHCDHVIYQAIPSFPLKEYEEGLSDNITEVLTITVPNLDGEETSGG